MVFDVDETLVENSDAEEERLIESDIVGHIKKLQKRGIKVVACTARSGDDAHTWTYDGLLSFGLDFNPSFDIESIHFPGKTARFYKGILIAEGYPKGQILELFLRAIKLNPSKIIFFDDNPSYLNSMQGACEFRKIPFEGYLYEKSKI